MTFPVVCSGFCGFLFGWDLVAPYALGFCYCFIAGGLHWVLFVYQLAGLSRDCGIMMLRSAVSTSVYCWPDSMCFCSFGCWCCLVFCLLLVGFGQFW